MAAGRLVWSQYMPALDSDGYPLPDALMYFYLNNTTTLATIYADEALTTPLANPVPANSSGNFPTIWADTTAVFSASIASPTQGQIATIDNLTTSSDGGGGGTVTFATQAEIQAGVVSNEAIAPDQAFIGMPVLARDIVCDARPSPVNSGDGGGILAAFNGDKRYTNVRIASRLRTSDILGQPTTGYLYTPEAGPARIWLNNNSGWNQATDSNDGRTGVAALRINATTGASVGGDTVGVTVSGFVQGAKAGATHFLANPASVLFNGDCNAGANGVLLGPSEYVLNDQGFAAAGIGQVISMNRTNASTALSATWIGFRSQAVGTQAVDAFYSTAGASKIGLDLVTANITQSAIAVRADQLITMNGTNSDPFNLPVNTVVGTTGFKFDSATSAFQFIRNGTIVGSIGVGGIQAGLSGTGSPEGVVVANRGQLYTQTDGAVGSTLWAKRGNDGTATNWETLGSQPNRTLTAKAGIILDDLQLFTGRVSGTIRNILNYSAGGILQFGDAAAGGVIAVFNSLVPDVASGAKFLGSTSNRWDTIYLINSPDISSDAREKTEVETPPALLREVRGLKMRSYKRNDGGLIRCGVFAQDVIACFERAGVDWREWDVVHEDDDGRLSVYYDHLFALKIAALEAGL